MSVAATRPNLRCTDIAAPQLQRNAMMRRIFNSVGSQVLTAPRRWRRSAVGLLLLPVSSALALLVPPHDPMDHGGGTLFVLGGSDDDCSCPATSQDGGGVVIDVPCPGGGPAVATIFVSTTTRDRGPCQQECETVAGSKCKIVVKATLQWAAGGCSSTTSLGVKGPNIGTDSNPCATIQRPHSVTCQWVMEPSCSNETSGVVEGGPKMQVFLSCGGTEQANYFPLGHCGQCEEL